MSRVVLTHAPRQATVSLTSDVRQKEDMNVSTAVMALVGALIVATVILYIFTEGRIVRARSLDMLPEEGTESEEDIIRLIRQREAYLAAYCHQRIHGGTMREAKRLIQNRIRNEKGA